MNRNSGEFLALKATKLLQKTNGSTYNSTYKRLRRQLEHLQLQVAEGTCRLATHCERQKCLLDLILHQDMVLQYLQLQLLQPGHLSVCGLAEHEQVCRGQSQDAAQCSTAQQTPQDSECSRQTCQQCSACPSSEQQHQIHLQEQHLRQRPPQHLHHHQQKHPAASRQSVLLPTPEAESRSNLSFAVSSYTANLLYTATDDELRLVASLTAEQWRTQFYDLFLQLVVLLELVSRCDALDVNTPGSTSQELPQAASAAPAVAATLPTAITAAAAAGSAEKSNSPAPDLFGAGPSASLQQLHAVVDRYTRRVMIAYLNHHVPLLEACTTNYVTHQRSAPAASHWQRVAKRLRLSDLQMLHMSIGHEEYARLNKAVSAECSALMCKAAAPSLLMAAAAQIEEQSKAPGLGSRAAWGAGTTKPVAAAETVMRAATAAAGHPFEKQKQQQAASRSSSRQGPSSSINGAAPRAASRAPPNAAGQQLKAEAAAAEGEDELTAQLDDQLKRHMRCRHLQLRMIAMFYLNTLTRLQIAHMVVSAFPYFPSLTTIAEIVHREWQSKQQQQCLLQLESKNEDGSEDYNKLLQHKDKRDQRKALGQPFLQAVEAPGAELLQQQAQQHLQQRSGVLQQQHLRWWDDVANCSLQLRDSH